jgi:hypothetical protein
LSTSTWDASPPVKVGTHIVVDLIDHEGRAERLECDVVPDSAADFDTGRLGIGTPLGKALTGRRAGSKVPYAAGDLVAAVVVAVTPSAIEAGDDIAAMRQATLDKARQNIERTNAEIFSTTFESKWGGYDASIVDWEESKDE